MVITFITSLVRAMANHLMILQLGIIALILCYTTMFDAWVVEVWNLGGRAYPLVLKS